MQIELQQELQEVWHKLNHITNSHDELYFFQKNSELSALWGAIEELKPLVKKYKIS